MNRRKYLAILGGMIAIAGCSGSTDENFEPTGPCEEEDIINEFVEVDAGDSIERSVELGREDTLFVQAEEYSGARPKVEVSESGFLFNTVLEEGPSEDINELYRAEEEDTIEIEFENEASITSGEWKLRVIHIKATCEDGTVQELSQRYPLPVRHIISLTVEDGEGDPIENANVEISDGGGFFSSSDVIVTGTTNENGKFSVEELEEGEYIAHISHTDYFDDEFELNHDSEEDLKLTEFDPTDHAEQVVTDILESQTDYDHVRELDVEESDEGIRVEASSDYFPFRATESEFSGKAADILEDAYESNVNIVYFELDLYGPTEDEFGNEDYSRALTVGMSRETADQINWDNYDSDNLSQHAEVYNLNFGLF